MPKPPSEPSDPPDLLNPTREVAKPRSRQAPRAARSRQKPDRLEQPPSVEDSGLLSLPDISGFKTMAALETAIGVLEPYLAELKRKCGNRLGAKRSAQARASKRPTDKELDAFFLPTESHRWVAKGASIRAAQHYGVSRRTIARWRLRTHMGRAEN